MASGAFDVTKRHLRGAEVILQFTGRHHHRPRGLGDTGNALREGGRARGMERDVALDLLHDLMDVAVQNRNGTESFQIRQRLRAVAGAPAPVLIHDPQRHMREHDDRRAAGSRPLTSFSSHSSCSVAEIAETVALQIDHVHQPDEVHAVRVEAVPAVAIGAFTIPVQIALAVFLKDVVFARNGIGLQFRGTQQLRAGVELRRVSTNA